MTDVRSLLQQWHDRYSMVREPDVLHTEVSPSAFSDAVLELMKDRNINYNELAQEIGVPGSTVYRWIRGTVSWSRQYKSREAVRRLEVFAGKAPGELQRLFELKSSRSCASVDDDWVSRSGSGCGETYGLHAATRRVSGVSKTGIP